MSTALPERYRALRSLGKGAMGEVWLVRDRQGTGKEELALKICRTPPGSDALARFRREFLTLAHLESPALPEVRDFGTSAPDTFWFTYRYV